MCTRNGNAGSDGPGWGRPRAGFVCSRVNDAICGESSVCVETERSADIHCRSRSVGSRGLHCRLSARPTRIPPGPHSDQGVYVEIWLEKDSLAGILFQETSAWDVPLRVTRGCPSVSCLYDAGSAIAAQAEPAYIYYFGDHDPSGRDVTRATDTGLREFAPDAVIHFQRVAVTESQVRLLGLPTRPPR
jgi:hypothetical protein